MAYYKPQSPIKKGEDYIYPLTTVDQIVLDDGTRLSERYVTANLTDMEAGMAPFTDADTLGGVLASDYALKADVADNYVSKSGDTMEGELSVPSLSLNGTEIRELFFPVGSIYITSTNTSPSDKLGGEWELIDKLLKQASYNQNTTAITINTDNVTSLGTCLITVDGNTMEIYITLTTAVALTDKDVNLFTINLESIGVSSISAKRIVGNSDGGNGFVNASVNSAGNVLSTDVVTKTSGANMEANVGVQFSSTWKVNKNSRLDDFCDRFFWKRTA